MKEHAQVHIVRMNTSDNAKSYGSATAIRYSYKHTPLGELLLASTDQGLCYLAFVTVDKEAALAELKESYPKATYTAETDRYQEYALRLVLQTKRTSPNQMPPSEVMLPLHVAGTDFQLAVWNELLQVPYGETTTYGALAAKVNRPKACRAVGTAVGRNPISILIPCHRIVRTSGALGGYHWGVDRKIALLDGEAKHQSVKK